MVSCNRNGFSDIKNNIKCGFAKQCNFYEFTHWMMGESLANNAKRIAEQLLEYTHLEPNPYDGFVIVVSQDDFANTIENLARNFNKTMRYICRYDPVQNCLASDIEKSEWKFTFNQKIFYVVVLAPCYSQHSSRYNFGHKNTYILLQSKESFIKRQNKTIGRIPDIARARIRKDFFSAKQFYNLSISSNNLEAHKMIKPLGIIDPIVRWWEADE